ncbi:unnamed protein product [Acanthocheilonema viteae]|uniref:Chromo domain-containing protein n=1 Tax=Acanthocheilonema viteae TaxID=6277 RepID=A0A498S8T5_ACAVI|nr:unnamed protein product [Acanthocheilonema viteae]
MSRRQFGFEKAGESSNSTRRTMICSCCGGRYYVPFIGQYWRERSGHFGESRAMADARDRSNTVCETVNKRNTLSHSCCSEQQEVHDKPKEKPNGNPEEKTGDNPEEKADGNPKKKADGDQEEKADGNSEKQADGNPEEQVDGDQEEKTDGENPEEKAGGDQEEKADGNPEEKADGDQEEEADGKPEEQVDGNHEEKADGNLEEQADGNTEKKADDDDDCIIVYEKIGGRKRKYHDDTADRETTGKRKRRKQSNLVYDTTATRKNRRYYNCVIYEKADGQKKRKDGDCPKVNETQTKCDQSVQTTHTFDNQESPMQGTHLQEGGEHFTQAMEPGRIIRAITVNGKTKFLVKWKNTTEISWVPKEVFEEKYPIFAAKFYETDPRNYA